MTSQRLGPPFSGVLVILASARAGDDEVRLAASDPINIIPHKRASEREIFKPLPFQNRRRQMMRRSPDGLQGPLLVVSRGFGEHKELANQSHGKHRKPVSELPQSTKNVIPSIVECAQFLVAMHPDLITFLASAVLPLAVIRASRGGLRNEPGYRVLLLGTVLIMTGTFLDYIEHFPRISGHLPLFSSNMLQWAIPTLLFVPGALASAWGAVTWLPNVRRMASEFKRRKSAERQLRQSEERARVLVEHAPEAIAILDASTGHFLDANPAAERLHGYRKEELVGKLSPWVLSPMHQADGRLSTDVAREKLDLAKSGQLPKFEWTFTHRNGHLQFCEVSLVSLPDQHDNMIRASITDVTGRKATEAALRRVQRIEAMAVLSGGAAHDFNNQLSIIQGSAELLSDLTPQNAKLVEGILRATKRGADLTQRLLSYARQQPIEPRKTDVGALVSKLAEDLTRTTGPHTDIQLQIQSDLWHAFVDPGQFEDALINLALNANDAMPSGGTMTFKCRNEIIDEERSAELDAVLPGPFVAVSVCDTGCGIQPDDLNSVFEPFYTTKEAGGGSGLGLASVFGFLNQSGGFVEATSKVGVGTCMSMHFPKYGSKKA